MPYVKPVTTVRLKLPTNPSYWVDWKENLTYGELKATARGVLKTSEDGTIEGADRVSASDSALLSHIAGWNLDDEAGNLMPLTVESLDVLNEEDSGFLLNRLVEDSEKQEKRRKK